MNVEDIKVALNAVTAEKMVLSWVQLGILVLFSGVAAFFGAYLKKKGENLATKEDVRRLTREMELVKAEISEQQGFKDAKYRLKHDACLKALSLIDAMFSHQLEGDISKQYASTEEARECHSMLILSCESTALLVKFDQIVFRDSKGKQPAPTNLLNEFRNLVRQELGFGSPLALNEDRAWFGKVGCEKVDDGKKEKTN
jgi:hypothetical protein